MKPQTAVLIDRTVGRFVYRLHRVLYRLTGGRIGGRTAQGPMLLLTTTGRKSGEARTTPLLYMPDGDRFVVVASNGGRAEAPAWLLNLEADSSCRVQVGRKTSSARAEILRGEEKAAVWSRLAAFYPGWTHYQTLTSREIPAVVLHPA